LPTAAHGTCPEGPIISFQGTGLKNRGYALQPEEEALKKRLEGLAKTVQDPAATGRMNEIWARMMVVQEKAKVMEENLGKVEIVWDENQLQTAGRVRIHTLFLLHLYLLLCPPISCCKATLQVSNFYPRKFWPLKNRWHNGKKHKRHVWVDYDFFFNKKTVLYND
jgi:hypothetical protein